MSRTIAVPIEDHFDPTAFRRFNDFFTEHGYKLEYMTDLRGRTSVEYGSNPEGDTISEHVTVTREIGEVDPADYCAVLLIGAYGMDGLRWEENPRPDGFSRAPGVEFLRRVVRETDLKVGTICHSLWLFCADPSLLEGRRVTCAHNIICDVENAGGDVVYEGDETAEIVIDGNLVSARHPGVVEKFMETFLHELQGTPAS
jgi:putative intracellular protease/amidase